VSPSARTRLLVAVAAILSAALVVGVTVLQADGGESAPEPGRTAREAPPLELGLGIRDDALARDLRAAEQALDGGRRADARRRFDGLLAENPGSVEAAVGAVVAAWPDATVERLEAVVAEHPASGVARLHLGLALFASGEDEAAAREWRAALVRDPDTPAALRAEDLLHPNMAPGRPPFVAEFTPPSGLRGQSPARQLAELERRAETGGAEDWIVLGAALQRVGRPVSAESAFTRAAELAPDDLAARVAAAVGRFDKDDPSQTFSRLGPLADENPRAGIVRYHLGLALSWIGAVEEARRQLRRASEEASGSFYGREAKRLLSRLEAVGP
jgi:tetratricopeptide (TPR) repeat protein